jgi:TolB protein
MSLESELNPGRVQWDNAIVSRSVLVVLVAVALVSSATAGGASYGGRPTGLIVFSCSECPDAPEPSGLFTIRPDGTGLRSIPHTSGDTEPAYSPDGRLVAVTRLDGIWVRRADGSHGRQLTRRHPQGYDNSPSWSPDGRRVVFDRGRPRRGGGVRRGLWLVAADTGRARSLLLAPSGEGAPEWTIGAADWSPDGRRIAFGFGAERLMTIGSDGTKLRRLGSRMLRGRDPHWSPDGRRLAFLEFSESASPHRFRILDLASGRVRTVFRSDGSVWQQTWSPDGQWLAIVASLKVECGEAGTYDCESRGLWIVDSFNGRRKLIHSFGDAGGDIPALDWKSVT